MLKPLPLGDRLRLFGDPAPFVQDDGSVSPEWPARILTRVALPEALPLAWDPTRRVTRISCHRLVAPLLERAFAALYADQGAWASINDYGGCYCWRAQRNSPILSTHAWAIAVDMDVADNPFGRGPKVHPAVVRIMEAQGFAWGGYFRGKRHDPMHWEPAETIAGLLT